MEFRESNRIQKYRAHNSVVDRMTNTDRAGEITAVEPVKPITNNPNFISYNSLLASDEFYDKLSNLQKEYRRFYHDQRELEKALKDMSENSESLSKNMKALVEKYNLAIDSLQKFDLHFSTNNRKYVEDIINEFRDNLKDIGIEISDNAILIFNEYKFKNSVIKSNDAIRFLFRPIKGLIMRLHKAFKNIKVPEEDPYYEYGGISYNGLFTDEKV